VAAGELCLSDLWLLVFDRESLNTDCTAVATPLADAHESRCAQAVLDFMLPRETPPRVIGDKAYGRNPFDRGIILIGMIR
jgi:hypothetical protein